MTAPQIDSLPLGDIKMGQRHRTNMGDLPGLARSIEKLGLLHPIAITSDHLLIAGGRRLAAVRLLGWAEVPVRIAHNISDAQMLLEAERDENACREDMKPSEYVALGMELEAVYGPQAAVRMAEGQAAGGRGHKKNSGVNDNRVSDRPRRTHDEVARAVGVSGATYLRARTVIQASEDETLPADVRAVAQKARDEMDATGKVNPAYSKVAPLIGKKQTAPVPPEVRSEPYQPTTDRQKQFAEAQKRRLVAALSGISGYCHGIDGIDLRKAVAACTAEEVAMWASMAGECARALRNLRSNLNGSATDE